MKNNKEQSYSLELLLSACVTHNLDEVTQIINSTNRDFAVDEYLSEYNAPGLKIQLNILSQIIFCHRVKQEYIKIINLLLEKSFDSLKLQIINHKLQNMILDIELDVSKAKCPTEFNYLYNISDSILKRIMELKNN